MPHTYSQACRYDAIQLLLIAASGRGGETLDEIANALGFIRHEPVRLARRMLARSIGAGTWREARAEAAERLRAEARREERAKWQKRPAAEKARWRQRRDRINELRRARLAARRNAA